MVRMGVLNIYDEPNPTDIRIETKMEHSGYDQSRLINDIGILRLASDINYNDNGK